MTRASHVTVRAGFLLTAFFLLVRTGLAEEDTRVDRATDKGLEYLARIQNSDGSWSYGSSPVKHSAVTSLAVLAFLAKGHTPGEGRYGDLINKGIDWVLGTSNAQTGLISENGSYWGSMYSHGTSTLMLAEAVGMTTGKREQKMREVLERAVKLTLQAQKVTRKEPLQQGGWRYTHVSVDSDISVTGWQLMSLRAAKNAGADVPLAAINDAVGYIKRSASGGGGFGYMGPSGTNRARAGTGILALELCGQHNTPEALAAAEWLMRNPPAWPDEFFYYAVYYCSQGMFQMGDKYSEFYRPRLEALLLGLQRDDGSWPTYEGNDGQAGPAYTTSMAVLALSVKYHYLPIYQR